MKFIPHRKHTYRPPWPVTRIALLYVEPRPASRSGYFARGEYFLILMSFTSTVEKKYLLPQTGIKLRYFAPAAHNLSQETLSYPGSLAA
jgi:hypothetical protein